MLKNDGVNKTNPSQFKSITSFKFFLTMLCVILILTIWCSFDNNIFTGLSLKAQRNDDDDYNDAYTIVVVGLSFFSAFLIIDFIVVLTGTTYCFNNLNILNVMLKAFEVFLLFYFYVDAWHYVVIWYIFIVTQLPCTIFEIYGIIYEFFYEFSKYNKIRANEIKHLEKEKTD